MEDLEVEGETEADFTAGLEHFDRLVPWDVSGFLTWDLHSVF